MTDDEYLDYLDKLLSTEYDTIMLVGDNLVGYKFCGTAGEYVPSHILTEIDRLNKNISNTYNSIEDYDKRSQTMELFEKYVKISYHEHINNGGEWNRFKI